ncbi:hypothetical protein, conserved [Trypanosoma brucei gambiense DAL972]|uniref:Uncharacterized protein n=2 Tax=Trypanosoma brucei TaxID=5691 RepID=D0A389_TRYB9|nr:hypothetical protein, conserved [Trypanosoma brucei gambiense DAL972]RHW68836.1 hypothetical protein DPX39_100073100 [Trypanosoma brucei equiperdum]CBH15733.1 hypothetical protein, conserved [Trypanosoma brucei gambiense DAL972]|eukprot:XP_011777997.1 hypothetical protein, conserved [Trypanosoma brucei gambiense DAL972]
MEAVVYEIEQDPDTRLHRLRNAMLAFVSVPMASPPAVALLVSLSLDEPPGSSRKQQDRATTKATAVETQLRSACDDRAVLLKWLRAEMNIVLDIPVAASFEPSGAEQLSVLSTWQQDQHRSPLRKADIVLLSLRNVAPLWDNHETSSSLLGRQRDVCAPHLGLFLLAHQSLLLDVTCCVGGGKLELLSPAAFSPLRARHIAKGRTAAVAFYGCWLSLAATPSGFHILQKRLQSLNEHVLSAMQLPLCCSYGGKVGNLQHNLSTVPSPAGAARPREVHTVSAPLLPTRPLRDIFSLLGFLLACPHVDYYSEATKFCTRVATRRKTALVTENKCFSSCATHSEEVVKRYDRKRMRGVIRASLSMRSKRQQHSSAPDKKQTVTQLITSEEPLWYEDCGS